MAHKEQPGSDRIGEMNLLITIIAILMIADALFIYANYSGLEPFIAKIFPNLELKKLAIVEGVIGAIILIIKTKTGTLT